MKVGDETQRRLDLLAHHVNQAANTARDLDGGLWTFYHLVKDAIREYLPPSYSAAFTKPVAAQLWARFPLQGYCLSRDELYRQAANWT
jgi:hypothetical protein